MSWKIMLKMVECACDNCLIVAFEMKISEALNLRSNKRRYSSMYNNEKTLKNGSKAYQLVEQLKKVATSWLQSDLEAKEKVIIQLEDLGRIFKPYHDEFQRIKEEKKQH